MAFSPAPIKKLDETVISLIAAGEVIHRPANAIKELLENSLDAKSTAITVTVHNGGLKSLQIKDNGTGIRKEDLKIVCERFTTSKLAKFEDLKTVATYGFRGEALSSISHIAHLTIVTMTASDKNAWKGEYKDGKLTHPNNEVVPVAGVKGTTITIEDLFYNVPRQKAFRKPQEEYTKIFDVVSKYAIHNAGIAITLKKKAENTSAVHTTKASSCMDCIRSIYGQETAKALIHIDCKDEKLKIRIQAYITNPTYSKKKSEFILFINHRLVDCKPLKKAAETAYATLLPRGTHPFIYISLELDPKSVDVNIHPTKAEVRFLYQDDIITKIAELIQENLEKTHTSRAFQTQNALASEPKHPNLETAVPIKKPQKDPTKMVRTDPRAQTLHAFVQPTSDNNDVARPLKVVNVPTEERIETHKKKTQAIDDGDFESSKPSKQKTTGDFTDPEEETRPKKRKEVEDESEDWDMSEEKAKKKQKITPPKSQLRKPISTNPQKRNKPMLTSIKNLLQKVEDASHPGLGKLFKNYSFVGCVNENFALVQHQTDLFLCNVNALSKDLIYQECLHKFGEFSYIKFSSPASLTTLCMLALDNPSSGWREEDGKREDIATFIVNLLMQQRQMLQEYFRMTIDEDGNLLSLPQIIPNYKPEIGALATFVLRLGTEVTWDSEQECFESLARELAEFYCLQYEADDEEDSSTQPNLSKDWTIEHVFFPAFRQRYLPPKTAAEDGTIVRVASLDKLYKAAFHLSTIMSLHPLLIYYNGAIFLAGASRYPTETRDSLPSILSPQPGLSQMEIEDKDLDEFVIDETELNDTRVREEEISEEEEQMPAITKPLVAEPNEPEFVEQTGPRVIKFRNYHPRDLNLKECVIPPPKDQLKPNLKRFEQISRYDGDETLLSLVPKTANWDLKRDIQPKMEVLERQTQVAIVELLKASVKSKEQK